MSALRIALLVPSLEGGGAEKVAVLLAAEFARSNCVVDLIVIARGGAFEALVPPSVSVHVLDASGTINGVLAVRRYIRRTRPAALIAFLPYADFVGALASLLAACDTALFFTFHTHQSTALRKGTKGQRRVLRMLTALRRRAAGSIVPSRSIADDMVTHFGWTRTPIAVIPNPVDLEDLAVKAAAPVSHPWLSGEHRLNTVVAVGRLTPAKDYPTLIHAIDRVRRVRDIRLLVIGEGPERLALEELVRALGMQDLVDIPGFSSNPYPLMRAARLLVLSSAWEGFGNVLVEAMAVGVPIVATACPGGPSEILEQGKWGVLVPPGDAEALAGAIIDALDAPRQSGAATERAREYDVAHIAARYLSTIESLAPLGQGMLSGQAPEA